MTKLEAFGVQCFLLLVLVSFGVANLCGITIHPDNAKWIEKIWDVTLLLIAPSVFSTALQQALDPATKEKNNEEETVVPTLTST
jgi:hypothetical protein